MRVAAATSLAALATAAALAAIPASDAGDARSSRDRWHPRPTTQPWQWQLSGRLRLAPRTAVYDIDGLDARRRAVRALHRRGRRVICYVSAGSHEPFRADARRFPRRVIGRRIAGFPDERWLDIRRIDLLAPILRDRFEACRRKGFDAVEPDNVDGYSNRSGFPLTAADQLAFNRWVAGTVRSMGMAVGLKNDPEQVRRLVGDFDFAVVEQCFEFRECRAYSPFVRRRKAVYLAEYRRRSARVCRRARRLRFSLIFKRRALGAARRTCRRGGR